MKQHQALFCCFRHPELQTPRTSAPALQCASRARSSADAHRLLLFLPRRQPHMSKSHRDELAASAPILCLWALGAQVAALVAPCLQALLAARRAQRTRHPRQSSPRESLPSLLFVCSAAAPLSPSLTLKFPKGSNPDLAVRLSPCFARSRKERGLALQHPGKQPLCLFSLAKAFPNRGCPSRTKI